MPRLGATLQRTFQGMERDLHAGMTSLEVTARHHAFLKGSSDQVHAVGAWSAATYQKLGELGIGRFSTLQPDPPLREVQVPVVIRATHELTRVGDTWVGRGSDPSLVLG